MKKNETEVRAKEYFTNFINRRYNIRIDFNISNYAYKRDSIRDFTYGYSGHTLKALKESGFLDDSRKQLLMYMSLDKKLNNDYIDTEDKITECLKNGNFKAIEYLEKDINKIFDGIERSKCLYEGFRQLQNLYVKEIERLED